MEQTQSTDTKDDARTQVPEFVPVTSPDVLPGYNHRQSIGLGIAQLVIGVLCLVSNAISIALASSLPAAYAFWTGILFIVTGSLGISSGKTKIRSQIVAYMALCILSECASVVTIVVAIMTFVYDVHLKQWCNNKGNDNNLYYACSWMVDVSLAMEMFMACAGVTEGVLSVTGMVICYRAGACRRSFLTQRPLNDQSELAAYTNQSATNVPVYTAQPQQHLQPQAPLEGDRMASIDANNYAYGPINLPTSPEQSTATVYSTNFGQPVIAIYPQNVGPPNIFTSPTSFVYPPANSYPPASVGTPANSYPPANFGTPANFYPPANFGTPANSYPPASFGTPANSYPPANFGTPANSYPPANFGTPANSYPPASFGPSSGFYSADFRSPATSVSPANFGSPVTPTSPIDFGHLDVGKPDINYNNPGHPVL